jgi:hypothetical protein
MATAEGNRIVGLLSGDPAALGPAGDLWAARWEAADPSWTASPETKDY